MATRYQSLTTSASLVLASAVGGALYTAASAHDARGTLGVSADPTTAVGDTVYRASALPDAGLQRLAVGVDASVLTSINGVPTWQAASGGGATIGSGTYASRPATCAEGDSYRVTSGKRLGSAYACTAANTWSLSRIAYPGSVRPLYRWDPERLEGDTVVTSWPEEERGNALGPAGNLTAAVTTATNATSGLPVAVWSGSSGALRAVHPGPLQARARSLLLVAYSCDTSGTRMLAGWGGTASNAGWWLGTTGASYLMWVGGGASYTGGTAPSSTTPAVVLATYTGSALAVTSATLATSPSWSTVVATTSVSLSTSGILAGTYVPALIFGADDSATYSTDPGQYTLAWAAVYSGDITASRDAIVAGIAERLGL